MQSLQRCIQRLTACNIILNKSVSLSDILRTSCAAQTCNIHQSSAVKLHKEEVTKFVDYNKVIYSPQNPGEEKRPGYVCHMKSNIKYSPLKMWYIASFIRGMTVDEAVKQLSFLHKKGAAIAKDVILEAQQMAVEDHDIEYKSNLWVAESFVTKGVVIKGVRRHARARTGEVHYRHCHYYVRLEEGKPPKHYYLPYPKSQEEMLQDWLKQMRMRKVTNSL